jgi:hypothetical protein
MESRLASLRTLRASRRSFSALLSRISLSLIALVRSPAAAKPCALGLPFTRPNSQQGCFSKRQGATLRLQRRPLVAAIAVGAFAHGHMDEPRTKAPIARQPGQGNLPAIRAAHQGAAGCLARADAVVCNQRAVQAVIARDTQGHLAIPNVMTVHIGSSALLGPSTSTAVIFTRGSRLTGARTG